MPEKKEVTLDIRVSYAISTKSAAEDESITSPEREFRKTVFLGEEEGIWGMLETDRAHMAKEIEKIVTVLKERGYEELTTDPPA